MIRKSFSLVGKYLQFAESIKQRTIALFLLAIFLLSMATPPAAVVAMDLHSRSLPPKNSHIKPLDQPTTTQEHNFNYPSGPKNVASPNQAALDAYAPTSPSSGVLGLLTKKGKMASGEVLRGAVGSPKINPHELTDSRTANSTVTVNSDGSLTPKNYLEQSPTLHSTY